MLFTNRRDAGRRLAAKLLHLKDRRPVILALLRGGVPVAFEVAKALGAPLDVVLVRKLGHPWSPELAVGAIADGEDLVTVIDDETVAAFGIPQVYIDEEIARQAREIEHRRQIYFKDRPPADIRQRTAVVVDDGIATGATMRAALRAVRRQEPESVVLAVPVAPPSALTMLRAEADDIVCLASPDEFGAVGLFYADFRPVDDEAALALLTRAARGGGADATTQTKS